MSDATHPSSDDFALVNDLFDGRLDADQAARARARIEADPALSEMWDDLLRVRDCVREHGPEEAALEPPADFLERVRTAIAAEEARAALAAPAAASPPSPGPRRRPGRASRLVTLAYAAAAVVVLGLGLTVALRRDQPAPAVHESAEMPEKPDEAPEGARDGAKELGAGRAAVDELRARGGVVDGRKLPAPPAQPETKPPAKAEPPPARSSRAGRYLGPGGAVPPGMREPTDTPPAPKAPDLPAPVTPAGAAGGGGAAAVPPADPRGEPVPDASAAAREVFLVCEARDPVEARRELAGLLLRIRGEGIEGRVRRAPDPAGPATPPGAPRAPSEPEPPSAGAAPKDAGEALERAGRPRLYRLGVDAESLTLLEQQRRDGAEEAYRAKSRGDTADDKAPERRYLGGLTWHLDAVAWKRLNAYVGEVTWGEARRRSLAKGKSAGADRQPGPVEEKEAEEEKAEEGADAEATAAGRRKKNGVEAASPRPPSGLRSEEDGRLVRVRILIVRPR